jgi:type I restriction enzyme S subunit
MFLSLNNGGQREIERVQYGQTKPGLNLDQIRQFRVPVPSESEQRRFVVLVERHQRHQRMLGESLRQAEHLFQSLLHRAFADGLGDEALGVVEV